MSKELKKELPLSKKINNIPFSRKWELDDNKKVYLDAALILLKYMPEKKAIDLLKKLYNSAFNESVGG